MRQQLLQDNTGNDDSQRAEVKNETDCQRGKAGRHADLVTAIEHGHIAQFAQACGQHINKHISAGRHQQQVEKMRGFRLRGLQDQTIPECLHHRSKGNGCDIEEQVTTGN